jgi:large subunit ribosomal protein L17
LQDKDAVSELFRNIAAKIADRPGGYTRILKTGNRLGDNAEMCIIELVDYNEAMLAAKDDAAKGKKRRSRRGAGKKAEVETVAPAKVKTTEKAKPVAKEEAKVVEETQPVEEPKAEDVAEETKE